MPRSSQNKAIHYGRLSAELVRHLRGRRSQTAFARWLGFRANVCYSWESGRRHPAASVLFRIAERRIDLRERLRAFVAPLELALPHSPRWTTEQTAVLLRTLAGTVPASHLSRSMGVDRGSLARWLDGSTEPRLPQLFSLVAATTHRLVDFVDSFAEGHELSELRRARADLVAQRRLAYEVPWSHAVLRALELDRYTALARHDGSVVAGAIGLPVEEIEALLSELRRAGQVRRRGGRYGVGRVMAVDTRPEPERNRQVKAHWTRVALSRLERTQPGHAGLFSYNLFPISEKDLASVRELYVEYYERVRDIVAQSQHADRVVLLNLALVPLDE